MRKGDGVAVKEVRMPAWKLREWKTGWTQREGSFICELFTDRQLEVRRLTRRETVPQLDGAPTSEEVAYVRLQVVQLHGHEWKPTQMLEFPKAVLPEVIECLAVLLEAQ